MTFAEWTEHLASHIGEEAAAAWTARPQRIDEKLLAEIDRERRRGRRVVLLTNGSDALHRDLRALGLTHSFDAVYNSAELERAHMSVAVKGDSAAPSSEEPNGYHFISFVKGDDGHLYELEGGWNGPLCARRHSWAVWIPSSPTQDSNISITQADVRHTRRLWCGATSPGATPRPAVAVCEPPHAAAYGP